MSAFRRAAAWPPWLSVALLGLLALSLRLLYVWQVGARTVVFPEELDPGLYYQWGRRIAAGDWIGKGPFVQSPLYAYFLGILMRVIGAGVPRILAVQAVIGTGTVLLTCWLGRRLFGHRAGLVAGLLLAIYGPFLFYEGQVMKTFLSAFLTILLALLLDLGAERSSALSDRPPGPLFAAAGLVYGLTTLDRDNFVILAPCLALLVLILGGGAGRRGLKAAGLFTAGAALMIAPVTVRNWAVSGELVLLTTGGGEVFFIGNNADANGLYVPPPFVRPDPLYEHADFIARASEITGTTLTAMQSSWFWFRQGLQFIVEEPAAWVRLLWLKMAHFWNFYELPDNLDYEILQDFSPLLRWMNLRFENRALQAFIPPAGIPAGALPTGAGWLPIRIHLLSVFGSLAPLGLAGIVLTRRRWFRLLPLYVLLFGYAATVLLFFNFSRFRIPIVPILAVFAAPTLIWIGGGVAAGWQCARSLVRRSGDLPARARALVPGTAGAVTIAVLVAAFGAINVVRPRGVVVAIEQALNRGNALYAEERIDGALASFVCGLTLLGEAPGGARGDLLLRQCFDTRASREAIRSELEVEAVRRGPQFKGIHIGIHHGIGLCLLEQADDRLARGERHEALPLLDDAIAQFQEVGRLSPAFLLSIRKMARAYELRGDSRASLEWLQKGVELWPEDVQARFDLAEILHKSGDHAAAMRHMEEAWRYAAGVDDAKRARMYFYRGLILYRGLNEPGKALYDFERALSLDPAIPQAEEIRRTVLQLRVNGVQPIEDAPAAAPPPR